MACTRHMMPLLVAVLQCNTIVQLDMSNIRFHKAIHNDMAIMTTKVSLPVDNVNRNDVNYTNNPEAAAADDEDDDDRNVTSPTTTATTSYALDQKKKPRVDNRNEHELWIDIPMLAQALETNTSLTVLNLENSMVDDTDFHYLVTALTRNTTLHTINLERNAITHHGLMDILIPTLSTIHVEKLWLGKNYDCAPPVVSTRPPPSLLESSPWLESANDRTNESTDTSVMIWDIILSSHHWSNISLHEMERNNTTLCELWKTEQENYEFYSPPNLSKRRPDLAWILRLNKAGRRLFVLEEESTQTWDDDNNNDDAKQSVLPYGIWSWVLSRINRLVFWDDTNPIHGRIELLYYFLRNGPILR